MGVFTPVAAPPRRIRASLGPARFTRVATQRQVPPAPRFAAEPAFANATYRDMSRRIETAAQTTPTAPPRVPLSSVVVSRKRPHRGERFSPSGENSRSRRRRPREAQTTPVSRLAVRGIVQASKERGDARQRRKTERGSFLGQPRWTGETPRSVLGGFAACVAPTSRGESVESAKHTSTARRTHHKPRPAPDGAKREQLLGRARHEPIGRGGGKSPKPPLERARHNANAAKGNTAEPSLGRRTAHLNANAAAPRPRATAIQPPSWDEHRTRSWARGRGK